MRMTLGVWAPDLAEQDMVTETGETMLVVATNVHPMTNSYRPIAGADTPYSDALPANPRGLWYVQKQAGTYDILGGTQSTLQKMTAAAWGQVGSGYSVPDDENWSGVQVGTNFYATNFTDGPQIYDIEVGGNFSALGGSPPTGRVIEVVNDHLFLGSTDDDPFGVAWSDTDDFDDWSAGNSGSQTFPDTGRVQAICGAASRIITERAIWQITFQPGSSVVFTFDKIEQAKGTIAPSSVVKIGNTFGYLAEDGFWFNGEPIGEGRVNDYFFALIDRERLFSVLGALDPVRPIIYWLGRTSESDTYDFGLMYNWQAKRWALLDYDILFMAAAATPGLTLEELAALYPNLETVPYSLDSRVWQGGRPVPAIVGTDKKLAFFEGSNLEATIETGERNFFPGKQAWFNSVAPLTDTSSAVVAIGKRQRQADARSWTSEASMMTSGICYPRARAKLARFRIRFPSATEWTHIQGFDVEARPAGFR